MRQTIQRQQHPVQPSVPGRKREKTMQVNRTAAGVPSPLWDLGKVLGREQWCEEGHQLGELSIVIRGDNDLKQSCRHWRFSMGIQLPWPSWEVWILLEGKIQMGSGWRHWEWGYCIWNRTVATRKCFQLLSEGLIGEWGIGEPNGKALDHQSGGPHRRVAMEIMTNEEIPRLIFGGGIKKLPIDGNNRKRKGRAQGISRHSVFSSWLLLPNEK